MSQNRFNQYNNRTLITGIKDSKDLEERVERCKERGYEEVGRHDYFTVDKFFTRRRVFQSTRESHKVTVVMQKIEKGETNQ